MVKLYCGDTVVLKFCGCGCVVVVMLAHRPFRVLQDPVKMLEVEFMVCLCLFDLENVWKI